MQYKYNTVISYRSQTLSAPFQQRQSSLNRVEIRSSYGGPFTVSWDHGGIKPSIF